MGYTTDFEGSFEVTPALNPAQVAYLNAFSATRRMKRDAAQTEKIADPIRDAVLLPVGVDGGFFVGADKMADRTPDVINYNRPPRGQPGLWCQWVATEDGTAIEWDGGEKFYDYDDWLVYLIENFLKAWGCVLNGAVTWQGEDDDDKGRISVKDNVMFLQRGRVVYE